MPELSPNARRLAAEQARGPGPQGLPATSYVAPGVIVGTAAGAAADGNTLASVTVNGTTSDAAYLASYTPTLTHVVAVLVQDGVWTILGRIIGTPV